MLGAEQLLADRQRALEERSRPHKVALVLKQAGEVVEARRRIGMLGAEQLLTDRQRTLEERSRPRICSSAIKIVACPVQKVSAFRVRSGVRHFRPATREQMRRQRRTARPG